MVSFITPLRNREDQIPGLIFNITKYYQDFEIILANQADNTSFKHGQLRNLGYNKSKGDIVIFIDVDVRLLHYIDFVKLQNEQNQDYPLLLFNQSYEATENNLGDVKIQKRRNCLHCIGRLLCFTRKQFERCGGYSNLCVGWSWEDNLLCKRAHLVKIKGEIAHISHDYQRDNLKYRDHNKLMHDTDEGRDPFLDGFRQTIAKEGQVQKIDERTTRYNFYDIGVRETFEYIEMLEEIK